MPTELTVVCGFCGQASTASQATLLIVTLPDGGEQLLYCHSACLAARLHPSVPFAG